MRISASIILIFSVMFLSSVIMMAFMISSINGLKLHLQDELRDAEMIQNQSHLNNLAQNIKYYDEVLTQSARNYALTGDVKWKERYKTNEKLLDLDIRSAITLGGQTEINYFDAINYSNAALVEMEYKSMELTDKNQRTEAVKILESEEYANFKSIYKDALDNFAKTKEGELFQSINYFSSMEGNNTIQLKNSLQTIIILTAIHLAINFLMLLLIIIFISKFISKPLKALDDIAIKIGGGDFNARINFKSKDEMGELADTINTMASQIHKYQQEVINTKRREEKIMEKEIVEKTKSLQTKIEESERTKLAVLNMMEDLQEANENLKGLDKAKTNFLNMVSHELKTPLTAIFAHLDVIDDMKANLSEQELKSLDAVKRNSDNLKTLIDNLLEISRIEAGKFELNITSVDIGDLINTVIRNVKILAEKKGIAIKTDIEKISPINADEMRVKEIVTNLVGNSIKFTEKGSVTVSVKKSKDSVVISIADTGIGIPADKMKNLFQNFYQVDSSSERRYGGTGLGLAISKQLVNAHGGQITVKSVFGKGATFTFTIPLKRTNNNKRRLK